MLDFVVAGFRAEFMANFFAVKAETKISKLCLDFFSRPSMAEIMVGNDYFM